MDIAGSGAGNRLTIAASVASVIAVAFGLAFAYDAPGGDVLLWFLVEALYVVLPGWLAFRLLSSSPGGALRQLTIGWVLGYTLETLAFMATAATDSRALMTWYPLLIGLPLVAVLVWQRRHRSGNKEAAAPAAVLASSAILAIGGMVILAIASYSLNFFSLSPLPNLGHTTSYFQDFPWTISLAADALHHWPMTDPSVSGEPLPYHNFSILHLASMSQVTGIDLSVGFFRLWVMPLAALITLLLVEAGRSLFGSVRAGLIAAFLLLFVGEFQLLLGNTSATLFGWLSPVFMTSSPSYLFGLPFLIALFVVCGGVLMAPLEKKPGLGDLSIIALLAIGAAGAKVSILPLLGPALVIFLVVRFIRFRQIDWRAVAIGVVFTAVQLFFYWTLYRGHSSGLKLDPGSISAMKDWPGLYEIRQALDFLPVVVLDALSIVLDLVLMLVAPLAGLYLLLRDREARGSAVVAWLLAVLATGFLTLLLVTSDASGNYLYGVNYGFVAGVILSAAGLNLGWRNRPSGWERQRVVISLVVAWILCMGLLVLARSIPGVSEIVTGLVALCVAFVIFALVAGWLLRSNGIGGTALLLSMALVATGFVGAQFSYRWQDVVHPPTYNPNDYRMTPGIYTGLRWLHDETPTDTVFAVNDQYAHSWNFWPTAYDYAAFSERRAFFAAWAYSQRVRDSGLGPPFAKQTLFPERKKLNDAAFAGDPAAIRTLHDRYGVSYLVIDRVNGDPADLGLILKHSKIVFDDPDLVIVRLDD